jgi:hypothetical protein
MIKRNVPDEFVKYVDFKAILDKIDEYQKRLNKIYVKKVVSPVRLEKYSSWNNEKTGAGASLSYGSEERVYLDCGSDNKKRKNVEDDVSKKKGATLYPENKSSDK